MIFLATAACVSVSLSLTASAQVDAATAATEGRAKQHLEAGRLDAAEALVRKVLAERPSSAAALLVLGGVLERRGDLAGATDAYERAIVADPKSATAHDKLGFVLGRQNRVQDALAAFSRAIELDHFGKPNLFLWR